MGQLTEFYRRRKSRIVYVMGGKCAICGYNHNIQALDMHHIDPSKKDFAFGNTKEYHNWDELCSEMQKCILLCANCHRELHNPLEEDIEKFKNLKSSYDEIKAQEITKEIEDTKVKKIAYCVDCGKELSRCNAIRCQECNSIYNRIAERPNREQFKNLIRTMPFTQIGRQYNVTDNAIRKWCDSYNLPRTKKEINSYSDEDWDKI